MRAAAFVLLCACALGLATGGATASDEEARSDAEAARSTAQEAKHAAEAARTTAAEARALALEAEATARDAATTAGIGRLEVARLAADYEAARSVDQALMAGLVAAGVASFGLAAVRLRH